MGMGKTVDAKQMMTLHTGDFATAPANAPHYAQAHGATIVQVHAMGPFALTYVNPADMPKATASR
jgi:quercetin dioxygenase-like cupin family protein